MKWIERRFTVRLSIEQIVEGYSDYLLRIAYIYVKDKRYAEEIVQDVFINFYKKQDQFREQSSLKTYLTKMTVNRSYDYLRSWKSKKELLFERVGFKGNSKDSERLLMESEEKMELTKAVLQLKIKYREVILLYYFGDYSIEEIAQLLHTPNSTIKSRIQRARNMLKEILQQSDLEVLINGNE
ncbi:sigma-70 family RNA polymerase sigma factor [Lysinibacillus endophyticus]|uniref:Sigma-70 family RNA polymerase sigma factor n=1 Tax=Ureibacillus endophyticus TaxID=1978490 RepID=A0A494YZU8_9BACL|nr:sigma-70 family RNA polymerase sigma factor [Lysinibacillus endophyticus]RKQ15753.1 sigma-70 family RNA polymerase sigma factor [Lysinibacillus endophyticus]